MSRRFYDRFMLHVHVGRAPKIRRLTIPERYALIVGVWALAAESPVRGSLLIAEGFPVEAQDVADTAGVSKRVAQSAMDKARALGLIETRDGLEWVHDWHDFNPDPRPSETPEAVAERKRQQRERERLEREGYDPTVTPMSRVTHDEVTRRSRREGKDKGKNYRDVTQPNNSDVHSGMQAGPAAERGIV